MTEMPIGVHQIDDTAVYVSGHQGAAGVGVLFGPIGVAAAHAAAQSTGEKKTQDAQAQLRLDMSKLTEQILADELTRRAAEGRFAPGGATGDGRLEIVPYLVVNFIGEEQVRLGFAPQLTLEAELALRHGFSPDILPGPVEALLYLRLNHDPKSWEKDKKLSFKGEAQADVTARHLAQLLDHLASLRAGREPWLSRRAPAYIKYASPYDQLARVKEWSAAPDLGGDAGDEA